MTIGGQRWQDQTGLDAPDSRVIPRQPRDNAKALVTAVDVVARAVRVPMQCPSKVVILALAQLSGSRAA
jgi:hypothetical protein